MNRTLKGLALLPRHQLRRRLNRDTRQWIRSGHQITELPPGRARGLCHYDTLGEIMLETGLRCEY